METTYLSNDDEVNPDPSARQATAEPWSSRRQFCEGGRSAVSEIQRKAGQLAEKPVLQPRSYQREGGTGWGAGESMQR